jgi:hypothetical protein
MKRITLIAFLALCACATLPVPPAAGPTAAFGQVASLGPVRVTPLAVIEDSRCPARVRCIWAGRLRIQAVIVFNGGSEELRREMILGEPVTLPEGRLTLAEALPGTRPGERIAPGAYRFTFRLDP